jgi:hypothetical protein
MSDGAKSRQEEIEDRKQWRTISRRTTTLTITDNNGARRLCWFEEPEGFRPEEGRSPANEGDAYAGWSYCCGLANPRIAHLVTPLFQSKGIGHEKRR